MRPVNGPRTSSYSDLYPTPESDSVDHFLESVSGVPPSAFWVHVSRRNGCTCRRAPFNLEVDVRHEGPTAMYGVQADEDIPDTTRSASSRFCRSTSQSAFAHVYSGSVPWAKLVRLRKGGWLRGIRVILQRFQGCAVLPPVLSTAACGTDLRP